jgi:hypothetical protein
MLRSRCRSSSRSSSRRAKKLRAVVRNVQCCLHILMVCRIFIGSSATTQMRVYTMSAKMPGVRQDGNGLQSTHSTDRCSH